MTHPDEQPGRAEHELNELRAALMHTLRLKPITEPGPQGLTILRPPPDDELLAEVHRLRTIAETLAQHPTNTDDSSDTRH